MSEAFREPYCVVVRVTTSNGIVTEHTYPIPADALSAASIVDNIVDAVVSGLIGKMPSIFLHYPMTLYNVKYVASIVLEPKGLEAVLPDLPERVMGFVKG